MYFVESLLIHVIVTLLLFLAGFSSVSTTATYCCWTMSDSHSEVKQSSRSSEVASAFWVTTSKQKVHPGSHSTQPPAAACLSCAIERATLTSQQQMTT